MRETVTYCDICHTKIETGKEVWYDVDYHEITTTKDNFRYMDLCFKCGNAILVRIADMKKEANKDASE